MKSSLAIVLTSLVLNSIVQPSYAAKYLTEVEGMGVVAIAKKGTNNPKIITLTDRTSLCRQSIGTPREQACLQDAREKGMIRTVWNIDCKALTVVISNDEFSNNNTHTIDPSRRASRAVMYSYAIYDYACNTNHSRN